MSDMDMFAAMGISGFGKTNTKKKLDPSRFDKNIRGEVGYSNGSLGVFGIDRRVQVGPAPAEKPTEHVVAPSRQPNATAKEQSDSEPEYDPDEPGPQLPTPQIKAQNPSGHDSEPEYDPSDQEPEFDGGEDDLPTFPATHEIILKDHTKVVSALALDPSGARVVSGSHDYDVKLWDFGGMDARCKPFKSWEPAGTYYVRGVTLSLLIYFVSFANGRNIG